MATGRPPPSRKNVIRGFGHVPGKQGFGWGFEQNQLQTPFFAERGGPVGVAILSLKRRGSGRNPPNRTATKPAQGDQVEARRSPAKPSKARAMPATRRTPAAAQASGGDPGADSDDKAPNLDEDKDTESPDMSEATASARNHQVGSQFMLHRRLESGPNGVQKWVPCGATDVGHEPDSRVHRYDRMIGFKLEEREAAEVQASEVVADNQERGAATRP